MELKDIKAIIDLMRKNDLSVFEMEKDGFRLKLQKGGSDQPIFAAPVAPQIIAAPAPAAPASETRSATASSSTPTEAPGKEVTSPMVGTFYRAPEPGAKPFVDVGARVKPDTIVCIIEVMKLMNSVTAGVAGVVTHVLVENGQMVEHGQPLVAIRPK